MKKKMLGIFVVTLLLVATGITVAGTFKQTRDITIDSSDVEVAVTEWGEPQYSPAGMWIRDDKKVLATINPMGPTGLGRYTIVTDDRTDPRFYGYFPTAVDRTDAWGEMIRTGKNTYDFSMIYYAVDEDYNIVCFAVWSGTTEMTSHDTMDGTFTGAFYGPDQDPFGENPPMYCFGPYEYSYDRIPIVPPCGS